MEVSPSPTPTTPKPTEPLDGLPSAECKLICINPDLADKAWPYVGGLIQSAMIKTGLGDFAAVQHDVMNGGALLWIACDQTDIKAAAVTQIAVINGERNCTIVACAGHDGDGWLPLISGLEDYARNEECRAIRIFGRYGWARVFPTYKIIGYILEKGL
jgi:hypothetical protein